jgi:hypothetical protein
LRRPSQGSQPAVKVTIVHEEIDISLAFIPHNSQPESRVVERHWTANVVAAGETPVSGVGG